MPTSFRARFSGCCLTLTLVLGAACDSEPDSGVLSVAQVLSDPSRLAGQRIRVRGWSDFDYSTTLIGCAPQHPCCNGARGQLALAADRSGNKKGIGVPDLFCTGNECTVQCSPFDPTVPAFELVGVLAPFTGSPRFDSYAFALTEIDWAASSPLVGSGDLMQLHRVSIKPGVFIISLKNH